MIKIVVVGNHAKSSNAKIVAVGSDNNRKKSGSTP